MPRKRQASKKTVNKKMKMRNSKNSKKKSRRKSKKMSGGLFETAPKLIPGLHTLDKGVRYGLDKLKFQGVRPGYTLNALYHEWNHPLMGRNENLKTKIIDKLGKKTTTNIDHHFKNIIGDQFIVYQYAKILDDTKNYFNEIILEDGENKFYHYLIKKSEQNTKICKIILKFLNKHYEKIKKKSFRMESWDLKEGHMDFINFLVKCILMNFMYAILDIYCEKGKKEYNWNNISVIEFKMWSGINSAELFKNRYKEFLELSKKSNAFTDFEYMERNTTYFIENAFDIMEECNK